MRRRAPFAPRAGVEVRRQLDAPRRRPLLDRRGRRRSCRRVVCGRSASSGRPVADRSRPSRVDRRVASMPRGSPACGRRSARAAAGCGCTGCTADRCGRRGPAGRAARSARGSDGPNTATIGVPTAAARCIGPVSPVTSRSSCSRTAASVEQIDVAGHDRSRWSAGSAALTRRPAADRRARRSARSCAPRSHGQARATSREPFGSHCLIARPPLTWMPTSGPRPVPSRRSRARRARVGHPGSPSGRSAAAAAERSNAAATSRRALSTVCGCGS